MSEENSNSEDKENKDDRFRGIVLCCESFKYLDEVLSVMNFLDNVMGVPTKVVYLPLVGSCPRETITKDGYFLGCMTDELAIVATRTEIKTVHRKDITLLDKVKGFFGLVKYGYGIFDSTNRDKCAIDVLKCKRDGVHPLQILIHEIIHLERHEECENPACIGSGASSLEYGSRKLCDDCIEVLKTVINKYFKPNRYYCPECGYQMRRMFECSGCGAILKVY